MLRNSDKIQKPLRISFQIFFVAILLLFTGCKMAVVPFTKVVVELSVPEDALDAGKDGYEVIFTNIATGRTCSALSDSTGKIEVEVEEGIYNIQAGAQKTIITTVTDGTTEETYSQTVNISGLSEKQQLIGNEVSIVVNLQIAQQGNGFVIQEIYYAGSTTPANGTYYQDQYIAIYNNSDSVLYADGLSIAESTHLSNAAVYPYTNYPNDFIAGAIYTIPGSGTDYPVNPGGSLVIASLGIDHKTANANSPANLSNADFEWYDGGKDVDVPDVTNMIRTFCYSNTIWVLHVKGYHAYVIFKAPGTYDEFLAENTVAVQTTSGSSVNRVKIANSLIQDGVELGTAGIIGSKALSSAIDVSFTYCDGSYTGKSVKRKILKWSHNKAVLQDTNNSANDFVPNSTPNPGNVE